MHLKMATDLVSMHEITSHHARKSRSRCSPPLSPFSLQLKRPGMQREVVQCMIEDPEVRHLMLRQSTDLVSPQTLRYLHCSSPQAGAVVLLPLVWDGLLCATHSQQCGVLLQIIRGGSLCASHQTSLNSYTTVCCDLAHIYMVPVTMHDIARGCDTWVRTRAPPCSPLAPSKGVQPCRWCSAVL